MELGLTIDEVENLIKKHEAFEKSAIAQEERFSALERLTTFELKELNKRKEEEERKRQEELAAKQTPPTSPDQSAKDRLDGEEVKDKEKEGESRQEKQARGERPTSGADADHMEGTLVRKHEWEAIAKRASNRSWDKIFVSLRGTLLYFYKDQKSAKSSPEIYYKNETPFELRGGSAQVADDYSKKKHVFRVKADNGAEYLFQAKNDEEMNKWVTALSNVCEQQASGGPSSRSQTLPAAEMRKDEPKRRSFFTLKKS
ncbi:hypothetical protein M8J76_009801 [Diaphorina citri]|nr:hypothetical protein M8J76_009801 [Diaphorina citri]